MIDYEFLDSDLFRGTLWQVSIEPSPVTADLDTLLLSRFVSSVPLEFPGLETTANPEKNFYFSNFEEVSEYDIVFYDTSDLSVFSTLRQWRSLFFDEQRRVFKTFVDESAIPTLTFIISIFKPARINNLIPIAQRSQQIRVYEDIPYAAYYRKAEQAVANTIGAIPFLRPPSLSPNRLGFRIAFPLETVGLPLAALGVTAPPLGAVGAPLGALGFNPRSTNNLPYATVYSRSFPEIGQIILDTVRPKKYTVEPVDHENGGLRQTTLTCAINSIRFNRL